MADEIGWVIERADSEVSAPLYYAPQTDAGWDAGYEAACRFARQQDAQVIVDAYGLDDETGVRICEHMWCGGPAERVVEQQSNRAIRNELVGKMWLCVAALVVLFVAAIFYANR